MTVPELLPGVGPIYSVFQVACHREIDTIEFHHHTVFILAYLHDKQLEIHCREAWVCVGLLGVEDYRRRGLWCSLLCVGCGFEGDAYAVPGIHTSHISPKVDLEGGGYVQ